MFITFTPLSSMIWVWMSMSYIHYISYEMSEKALCFWFTESLIVTLLYNKQNILSKNFCQKLTILRQYSPKLKFRINHHVSGMTYSTIIYNHTALFPNINSTLLFRQYLDDKFGSKTWHSYTHRSLTDDRFNKNVTKKCGWVIVGFFSYITNLLGSKSDLLGLSSYIDFSISHVNSHLRNWSIFGFFAFIWIHWRPLVRKKYPKYGFRRNISR